MPIRHTLPAILLMLAGCVQTRLAYVPEGQSDRMGYAEAPIGPKRFRVSYSGPKGTPIAQLDRLALRRAAELSLSRGYDFFAPGDRLVSRGVYVLPGPQGAWATYRGGFGDWRRFWRFYCLGQGWKGCEEDPLWPSRVRLLERVEVAYTIDLLEVANSSPVAVDAARLLALHRAEDVRRTRRP
ncbi:CC0125/CC1285 family lipoprotein [Sphingomonas sp. UNC305MFCol5.2]|uniref:CC0125/CC1285 family lipoprotein n=1 Tax=Sphingomonas sp. UNC305MFCol5.2 TaxID=1449076 RepID=UPI00069035C3|nr:hypothetical protein [Sphingomonas sp. UNC305MFCol5.2]